MDVIDKINKLKDSLGYTTNSLATKSGITQSTLQAIMSRRNLPSIPTLEKICLALNTSLSEFFADDSNPPKNPPHIKELIKAAETLTPEQAKLITQLIKNLKGWWILHSP